MSKAHAPQASPVTEHGICECWFLSMPMLERMKQAPRQYVVFAKRPNQIAKLKTTPMKVTFLREKSNCLFNHVDGRPAASHKISH
jgi:hypothetical protein